LLGGPESCAYFEATDGFRLAFLSDFESICSVGYFWGLNSDVGPAFYSEAFFEGVVKLFALDGEVLS